MKKTLLTFKTYLRLLNDKKNKFFCFWFIVYNQNMVTRSGRLNFMNVITVVQRHLFNDPKENKDRKLLFILFFLDVMFIFPVLFTYI